MFDYVDVEQLNAWLRRADGEERSFDYIHGYLTALACAPPEFGDFDADIRRIAMSTEDTATLEGIGLDVETVDEYLVDLYRDIIEDLKDGDFRPHMGRYLRRIREDSPYREWCLGFLRSFPFFEKHCKGDEDLKMLFVPLLLLVDGIADLPPEELPGNLEAARKNLIASILDIYDYFHAEEAEE